MGRCASLAVGRVYKVPGIEGDWLRLLNYRSEPVLYDPACFRVVEAAEPAKWSQAGQPFERPAATGRHLTSRKFSRHLVLRSGFQNTHIAPFRTFCLTALEKGATQCKGS